MEGRQFHDGTYYSPNLEKHAAPASMTMFHPYLNEAKYENISDGRLRYILVQSKFVKYDYKSNTYKGKFPRLLIHIKDPELLHIAKLYNPEHYMWVSENIPQRAQHYFSTINNIKVSNVHCYCEGNKAMKKTQFEKILGKNVPNQDEIMCYAPCKHTIFAAAKRQIKSAPTPEQSVLNEFIEYSKNLIEYYLKDHLNNFGYSYADWFNHLPLQKQLNMQKVKNLLMKDEELLIDGEEFKKLIKMHYQGICKIELQPIDGKPRMVCSIPDIIKFVMGPITWHLEEIFANHFPGYCGGKNLTEMSEEINKYIDLGFIKVVEGDGSAFDNTQDINLKEIDRYIYRRILSKVYHVDKELFNNISQSYYKCMDIQDRDPKTKKLKTIMTYYVLGTVFSGDCDTTLANTIRMALYNHFVNYKMGLQFGIDYVLFSKGDDFTVMYKSYVNDLLINQYYNIYFLEASKDPSIVDDRIYGLGQVCKFLHIGDVTSFTFCSLRAWIIDSYGHITLTRDPSKLYNLGKYSRKTKCYNIQQRIKYYLTQALALRASYQGIHVFDTYAEAFIREAHKLYNLSSKQKQIDIDNYLKKNKLVDSRLHIQQNYLEPENIYYELMNDIQHREIIHNIQGSYWETMQSIERINTHKYTKEELHYINSQIDAEFDPNELKAILA